MASNPIGDIPVIISGDFSDLADAIDQATQAAATGAGDIINASDLGFGGFDEVNGSWSGYSQTGNYIAQVMPVQASDIPAGGAGKRVAIQWFTTSAAFGAKSTEVTGATNLSTEYVRLRTFVV